MKDSFSILPGGGMIDIAEWLVNEMKQDIAAKDKKGLMPIHYAAEAGQTKFAEWLSDKGQILQQTNNELWQYILLLRWSD